MIAQRVTFRNQAADERGPPFGLFADEKEGGTDAILVQHIKQSRAVVGVRTVVEGQTDAAAFCRPLDQEAMPWHGRRQAMPGQLPQQRWRPLSL
jgi:hypothetical protein